MYDENCPPEINSRNLYTGPGQASLDAAHSAWGRLGDEVKALQRSFNLVVFGLMDAWSSLAAKQVREAVMPFVRWLADLSAQLEEIEGATSRFNDAFINARQAIVPPEEIAFNRGERKALVISNVFGRNDAEIAEFDQEYQDYWDENVQVMRDYAHSMRDALSQLIRWPSPPSIANSAGLVQLALPSSSLSPEPVRNT